MPKAAYIHIPFCSQICHYCDFNKVYSKNQPIEDYLNALKIEMITTLEKYPTNHIETIFIGGGTPTALNPSQMETLMSTIQDTLMPYALENLEFTVEANPGGVTKDMLNVLQGGGVNRLSYGVQAFQDEILKKIGRSHTVKDIYETINLSKEVGFNNINIDLIYALPGQTISQFEDTLNKAISMGVQHFSGYSLQIEPKTVFYNLMRKGDLNLPSEDAEAAMYERLMNVMGSYSYNQYEISNFSLNGYESKHNLTYWNNEEYYGFGAGAHSYVSGVRRGNINPIPHYIKKLNSGELPFAEENKVTLNEQIEEELFLGLRKIDGVSKQHFFKRYNQNIHDMFHNQLESLKEKGLLLETDTEIKLSKQGLFLGNEVFQAFFK